MNEKHELQSLYFLPLAILFTTVLLVSNTVAIKITQIGPFVFDAGTILFPIAYIFGDVFTEVYGYKASRKIIWMALISQVIMAGIYALVQILPAASFWADQAAYDTVLGFVPRIVAASLIAFFAGEITNSYILSKMKVASRGKQLWKRTIGSTLIGQGVDTTLFVCVAFIGVFSGAEIQTMILSNYVFKVSYEILATPLTYKIIAYLKKKEGVDVYDTGVNYNPFTV